MPESAEAWEPVQETWELDAEPPAGPRIAPAKAQTSVSPPPVERILEALLFVGGSPLTEAQARSVVRGLDSDQFLVAIESLNRSYRKQGRPYTIQARDHGYVMVLRSRFHRLVERLYGPQREARLSPAAIDVLSLVAYRQPVTRQEVESIRGNDSSGQLRQLVRRGLIAVVQRAQAGAGGVAYGTTQRFLELFKLQSLDDLPQTQDLQRL